jgi:hypothetical protein
VIKSGSQILLHFGERHDIGQRPTLGRNARGDRRSRPESLLNGDASLNARAGFFQQVYIMPENRGIF